MGEEAKFALEILKQYALEHGTLVRGTSDLGPLEEWLIIKLFAEKQKDDKKEGK